VKFRFSIRHPLVALLALIAVASLHAASPASVSVRDFGAVGDGETLETATIQKALDAVADRGGGVVQVPAGRYVTGSLVMKSHTTLHLETGASLLGSTNADDYPIVRARWEGIETNCHRGLISADHAKDIAITGSGVIEGNPAVGRLRNPRGPTVMEFIECGNVRVEGVTLKSSRMWTLHPAYCHDVRISGVTFNTTGANSDGIDPDSCRRVVIDGCTFSTGDDNIAIKSGKGQEGVKIGRPSEDILITNCTFIKGYTSIAFGSELSGGIRRVRISHCTFGLGRAAMQLKSRPGRAGYLHDLAADHLVVGPEPLLEIIGNYSFNPDPQGVPGAKGITQFSHIRITDVRIASTNLLTILGPAEKPVNGIQISRVTGTCQKGSVIQNARKVILTDIHLDGISGPPYFTNNVEGAGLEGAVSAPELTMQTNRPPVVALALMAASTRAKPTASEPSKDFKFQFGAEKAAAVYTLVPTTLQYSKEAGYGFEPGANVTNVTQKAFAALHRGAVASSQPFFFSVAVPEGNYRVIVTLGDPKADAVTTVKAETRRLMLERIRTAAGKFETRTFMVNVRSPEISSGGEVNLDSREMNLTTHEAISRDWDDKLTLEFSDSHPALAALKIERVDDNITFFVCGDSTVTDQPGWPASSWGQMVTRWFKPKVVVANHAESGETLKGFLKERRWDKVLDSVRPGDYVIIEFGCNDSKKSGPQIIYPGQDFSETYVDADTTYKELLKRFAADVQKKGAFPVIVSPSARRQDVAKPTTLGDYAVAAIAAAKEIGVPSIDLNSMGVEINAALGADGPKQFNDQTHHVEYGSYLQSKCIVLGIQQAKLPLAKFIVNDFGNFDPKHPEPLPANFDLPPDPSSGRGGRGTSGGVTGASAPTNAPATTPQ